MKKDPRTHAIIVAAMEVHRIIGPGHLEAVYHECLEIEFRKRNIPFISKPRLEIYYKEEKLKKFYTPDFMVYKEIGDLRDRQERPPTEVTEEVYSVAKKILPKNGKILRFGNYFCFLFT